MPRQSTQRRASAMEDPDRRLKHQLRDLLLFGGLFRRRHRRFQRLVLALAAGLILRAGLVHRALERHRYRRTRITPSNATSASVRW
jgi:hypothetical protein